MLRRCNLVDTIRDEYNLVPVINCAMIKRNDSTAQQKPQRRRRAFFPGGFVVDRAGKASAKSGRGVVPLRPQQAVDAQLVRLVTHPAWPSRGPDTACDVARRTKSAGSPCSPA